MSAAFWAEALELAGTVLAAIPALRLSHALLLINRTTAAVDQPDVPQQIRAVQQHWRSALQHSLQGWNRADHLALASGVALLALACLIRMALLV